MFSSLRIQKAHLVRIAVLILLPFLIGAVLMPHTTELRGDPLVRPTEIGTGYLQTEAYEFTHVYNIEQGPTQVGSVFPLANYLSAYPLVSYGHMDLCIQDNGSYITYANGTSTVPAFTWNIHINNESTLAVGPYSVNCTLATVRHPYDFTWVADFPTDLAGDQNLSSIHFTPLITVYPSVVMDYGILQGLVFIPAFYLFIFYPAAGIWKKVHEGLLAQ
jgi:hypothetical protein